MEITKYTSNEFDSILELFYDTVKYININDYNADQIKAWMNIDKEKFKYSLDNNHTLVVNKQGKIIAFGNISNTGYIDYLYVSHKCQGQGIAKMLLKELELSVKTSRYHAHVSKTAKLFFKSQGYSVIKRQYVSRNNIKLVNYIMVK